jgi:hypothetical protein
MGLVPFLLGAAYPADTSRAPACSNPHQPNASAQAVSCNSHPNHLLRDPNRQSVGIK